MNNTRPFPASRHSLPPHPALRLNQIRAQSSGHRPGSITLPRTMSFFHLCLLCAVYRSPCLAKSVRSIDLGSTPGGAANERRTTFRSESEIGVVQTTQTEPTETTFDQEYFDYVMRATQLAAWKMNSWHEHWRWTTHKWELDPDFTTDLNMLVNDRVKKNQSHPIVDHAIIDHMKDMNAYCRCWKSKKFPLCDGAHNLHNNRTGDNVGPIFIKEPHLLNNSLEFYNHMCDLKKKK